MAGLTLRLGIRLGFYEKWIILAPLIGLVSGFFAVLFYWLLGLVGEAVAWLLTGSYKGPVYDIGILFLDARPPLLTPILMALGAGLGGLLVYTIAPEAEGHGTNAAVEAYHRRAGIVRPVVPPVKALASAFTVGSGGSGGVEGPSVQMGSGMGSWLAGILRLSMEDRRIALVAGMAGALSALFRSPLGAPFFSIEVLYKRDLEAEAFIPAFISSVTAYAVTAPLAGFVSHMPELAIETRLLYTPGALLAYVLLGLFLAPFGFLYAALFTSSEKAFRRLEERGLPRILKPVVGALAAGIIGLFIPHVLGSGRMVTAYTITEIGTPGGEAFKLWGLPLWLSLIIIALAKIAATSLSIGSGGSGGVFAPGLLVGALLGGSFGVLVSGTVTDLPPKTFAYMGMAVLFGAAAKVPLAASVMAAEMGGNYHLIAPTLLAAVIARRLAGELSIYTSQLPRRLEAGIVKASIMLAFLRARGLKSSLTVGQLVDTRFPIATPSTPLAQAVESILIRRSRLVIVLDDGRKPVGVIDAEDLEDLIERIGRKPEAPVGSIPLRRPPIVRAGSSVEDALDAMVKSGYDYVIVVNDEGKYVGVVTIEEIDAALAYIYLEEQEKRS